MLAYLKDSRRLLFTSRKRLTIAGAFYPPQGSWTMYSVMNEVAEDVRSEMAVVREAVRTSRRRSAAGHVSPLAALMQEIAADVRPDMLVATEGVRISRERAAARASSSELRFV